MRPYWQVIANQTFVNSTVSAASGNTLAAELYLQQVILPIFNHINSGQSNWTTAQRQPRPATLEELSGSGV